MNGGESRRNPFDLRTFSASLAQAPRSQMWTPLQTEPAEFHRAPRRCAAMRRHVRAGRRALPVAGLLVCGRTAAWRCDSTPRQQGCHARGKSPQSLGCSHRWRPRGETTVREWEPNASRSSPRSDGGRDARVVEASGLHEGTCVDRRAHVEKCLGLGPPRRRVRRGRATFARHHFVATFRSGKGRGRTSGSLGLA